MIGLGQIPTLGNSSRLHDLRLWESVARVDRKEAEQGAAHSDVVRLGAKERAENLEEVPLERYLTRVSKFSEPKKKTEKKPEVEEDCPIAKARAESLVGENAPLGWLTADHHGEAEAAELEEPMLGNFFETTSETTSVFSLSEPVGDENFMFEDEWFLSPCA